MNRLRDLVAGPLANIWLIGLVLIAANVVVAIAAFSFLIFVIIKKPITMPAYIRYHMGLCLPINALCLAAALSWAVIGYPSTDEDWPTYLSWGATLFFPSIIGGLSWVSIARRTRVSLNPWAWLRG